MKLLLTSSLSVDDEYALIEHISDKKGVAVIIVTASKEHKENNWHTQDTKSNLGKAGFEVRFLDLDFEGPEVISTCDFLYIAGGSPHYLLKRIKETNAGEVITGLIERNVPVMATSAGAVVLGCSTKIVEMLDPELDCEGSEDRAALGVIPLTILPHANRWKLKLQDFKSTLKNVENVSDSEVCLINDGESLLFEVKDHYTRIDPDDIEVSRGA